MNSATYQYYDCTFSAIGLTPGIYSVTVTATDDGIPAATSIRDFYFRTHYDATAPTSVYSAENITDLKVYPNPANSSITIDHEINQGLEPIIHITDIHGIPS
ncbi:MAG TPA: hypothetical protein VF868_14485 [Bacteroidia bacterium]